MRTSKKYVGRTSVRRPQRMNRAAGRLGILALFLALAIPAMVIGIGHVGAQKARSPRVQMSTPATMAQDDAGTPEPPRAEHIQPVSVTTVNFQQLAEKQAKAAALRSGGRQAPTVYAPAPPAMTIDDTPPGTPLASGNASDSDEVSGPAPMMEDGAGGPFVASPGPATNYLAQEDGPKVGTGSFTIPPDTQGAVGIDKVFTNTNSNYRVHDKATGAALSTVSADTFWLGSGGTGFFDPRIVFDPINQRWILAMDSNSVSPTSSIEIAVSQTSDPQGTYNMYRFVVGCANGTAGCATGGEWADFPMLGFNKNWIAVTMNMFSISASTNNNTKALVLDYPQARAGTPVATIFSGLSIGFCNHPAETYDPNQDTLFMAIHLSSGGATYRMSTITGTPSAPSLTIGNTQTRPGGGWTQPSGDILPQTCTGVPAQPARRPSETLTSPTRRYAATSSIVTGGSTTRRTSSCQRAAPSPPRTSPSSGRRSIRPSRLMSLIRRCSPMAGASKTQPRHSPTAVSTTPSPRSRSTETAT